MRSDRHIGRRMVQSKAWQYGLAVIGWLVLIAFVLLVLANTMKGF